MENLFKMRSLYQNQRKKMRKRKIKIQSFLLQKMMKLEMMER